MPRRDHDHKLHMSIAMIGWIMCSAPAALAGDCAMTSDPASACTAQAGLSRLGERLAHDPAPGRLEARLDGKPWIAGAWSTTPFAVTPDDQNVTVKASLGQWSRYTEAMAALKIEEAKALAPAALPIPKAPVVTRSPLDVWSTVQVRGVNDDSGHDLTGAVGADYAVGRDALVGLAAEVRDPNNTGIATYFALSPVRSITVKGKAQWDESRSDVAASDTVVSAELHGAWSFGRVKFAPMLSIAQGKGTLADEAGTHAIETRTLTVAPKISRPIPLASGQILEPFLTFKNESDIHALGSHADAEGRSSETKQSAGAGLNLAKPDSYALSVTTDLENLGSADETSLKSRLQLKVPLQ